MLLQCNLRYAFLVFELFLPDAPSWSINRKHILIKKVPIMEYIQRYVQYDDKTWWYSWQDGSRAMIHCTVLDSRAVVYFKRVAGDFCGYDWMVESIMENDLIRTKNS